MNRPPLQLPPIALERNVTRANRKSNVTIVLEIIIIILLFIWLWWFISAYNASKHTVDLLCPLEQSTLCDDRQPCTIDYIQTACGNGSTTGGGVGCNSYQCINVPLANGSCCNEADYCYLPDPAKACVFGKCKSPNITSCKGWCNGTADFCPEIPTITDGSNTQTRCIFNSCVTQIVTLIPVANADDLLDINTGNKTNLNIASCLDSSCVIDELNDVYICYYQWNCAPFVNAQFESKKRNIFINQLHQQQNTTLYFPIKGIFDDEYLAVNSKLNEMSHELITIITNSITV